MATEKTLEGQLYTGHTHIRFDEGEVVSATTSRRGVQFCKGLVTLMLSMGCLSAGVAWGRQISVDLRASQPVTRVQTCIDDMCTAKNVRPEDDDEAMELGEYFGLNWRTSKSRPWMNSDGFWFDPSYWHQEQKAYLWSGEFRQIRDDMPNYPTYDYPEPDKGVTWIETSIHGPTCISFLYAKYTGWESPFTISVDGETVWRTTDSMNMYEPVWQEVEIPAGDHVVRLTFEAKDWFCGYATFNGILLYDVRRYTQDFRPVIAPASTEDENSAITFNKSCTVTITNGVPGSTIYYTLDGRIPDDNATRREQDNDIYNLFRPVDLCNKYVGPFTVTTSVFVRAVAVMPNGSITMPESAMLLERHAIEPGEWTADADGALAAAVEHGRMVIARRTASNASGVIFEEFTNLVAVTESAEFLDWAKSNGVYLIRYDDCAFERQAAYSYFMGLAESIDDDHTALICVNAWKPRSVTFCVPWNNEYSSSFSGVTAYGGTASELVAMLSPHLYERPQMCTVTFNSNGGAIGEGELTQIAVPQGQAIGELPAPTRPFYNFSGWFTAAEDGMSVSASTIATGDVTYYAHWTANGGGSGEYPGMGGGESGGEAGGGMIDEWIAGRLDTGFAKAQTVLGALYGRDGVPVGTVQVKVGKVSKKGEVKISASATVLVDGKAKKVSAKAVSVVLDATGRVPPVKVAFAAPIGEMAFEMAVDGTFRLKNASYVMVEKSVGGNWTRAGARVWVDGGRGATALPAGTVEELLPDGEPVIPKAGKWSFAKAAGVKWAKPKKGAERPKIFDEASGKGLIVDDSKGKTNLSGLKLTYMPKTGIFKGSFKIYAIQGGKLKKIVVKVIGVVVDGKGSGSATGPGGVSFAVTVE